MNKQTMIDMDNCSFMNKEILEQYKIYFEKELNKVNVKVVNFGKIRSTIEYNINNEDMIFKRLHEMNLEFNKKYSLLIKIPLGAIKKYSCNYIETFSDNIIKFEVVENG